VTLEHQIQQDELAGRLMRQVRDSKVAKAEVERQIEAAREGLTRVATTLTTPLDNCKAALAFMDTINRQKLTEMVSERDRLTALVKKCTADLSGMGFDPNSKMAL
jgi:hypothetical protein